MSRLPSIKDQGYQYQNLNMSYIQTESNDVSQSLMMLQKQKKQIESDAQQLNNRIGMLREQELKTWKQTQECQLKEIELQQQRKEQQEHHDRMQRARESQEKDHIRLKAKRYEQKKQKEQKQTDWQLQRQERREDMLSYFQEQKEKKKNNMNKDMMKRLRLSKNIKEQTRLGKQKKQYFWEQKKQKVRQQIQILQDRDENYVHRLRKDVYRMQQIENELLKRIELGQQIKQTSQGRLNQMKQQYAQLRSLNQISKTEDLDQSNASTKEQVKNILTDIQ